MNPFIIKGYAGPDYFCDRERETKRLLDGINNQRNITLISLRKMGKTGLIFHAFHQLDQNKFDVIYTDIYDTDNLTGFINRLASSLLSLKKSFHQKLMEYIGSFRYIRPVISIDPLSGLPTASFKISSEEEAQQTIKDLFQILEKRSRIKPVILAIDEFQQITKYPERNIEAMLRSHIQHMQQVSIIFSGSNKSLLRQIFASPSRPFYQSTELIYLDHIPKEEYHHFIKQIFLNHAISIGHQEIEHILEWTKAHTFYVQYCCHKLFEKGHLTISSDHVTAVFQEILMNQEPFYFDFRNLLTQHQWQLLKAIAKEKGAKNVTSSAFIKHHNLTSTSSVQRGIESLMEKELIYRSHDEYYLQDVYFSRWLEMQE